MADRVSEEVLTLRSWANRHAANPDSLYTMQDDAFQGSLPPWALRPSPGVEKYLRISNRLRSTGSEFEDAGFSGVATTPITISFAPAVPGVDVVKTAWEQRVAWLLSPALHPTEFTYAFKPVDSAMYGGQPRIDFHAADIIGRFWGVEVKSLSPERKSFNLDKEISAGQVAALNDIRHSYFGVPILAIGQGRTLYVFNWRHIYSLVGSTTPLLPLTLSSLQIEWRGPKSWKSFNLYQYAQERGWLSMSPPSPLTVSPAGSLLPSAGTLPSPLLVPAVLTEAQRKMVEQAYQQQMGYQTQPSWAYPNTPQNPVISDLSSTPTPEVPSPSTSKPKDSIRTRRRKRLSGL